MAAAAAQNQDFAGVGKSASLTASLERAHRFAVERTHGVVTLEHLLMALTEDQDASAVFSASPVDLGRLRGDLAEVLTRVPPPEVAGRAILPNADLLRVLRLAATAAQQSQRTVIDGMIVLAAIIGDGKTAGAQLLNKHGLTFNEVIRVLQSAAPPRAAAAPVAPQQAQVPPPVVQPPRMVAPPAPQMPPQTPQSAPPPPPPAAVAPSIPAAPVPPPIVQAPPAVEAVAAKGQSTEDLLASVRARLQEGAPPPVLRPASPQMPQQVSPQVSPQAQATDALQEAAASMAANPAASALVEAAPALVEPAPAPQRAPPRLNPAPVPLGRLEQPRAEGPPGGADGGASTLSPAPQDLPPTPRSGPPPLPTVAPSRDATPPPVGQPAMGQAAMGQPAMGQAGTGPAGLGQASAPPRGVPGALQPGPQAAPTLGVALPLPTVDVAALADSLPETLARGVVSIVEVAIPRRAFEMTPPMPQPRPGVWPPMRVATLRLFSQGDDVIVEPLSPPSLWLRIWRGPGDTENIVWRWRVLPRKSGTAGLSLTFGVRTVGPDGIGQEALWPEETVGVRIGGGRGRRVMVGTLFLLALLGGGYAGLFYAGKTDLLTKPVLSLWQSVAGKK